MKKLLKGLIYPFVFTSFFTNLMGCHALPTALTQSSPIPIKSTSLNADSDRDGIKDSQDQCPNTPPNVVINQLGCPIEIESDVGVRGIFHDVYTNHDIALSPQYRDEVSFAMRQLKGFAHQWVIVAGFDGKGTLSDNLTTERLHWLKTYLLNHDNKIRAGNVLIFDCQQQTELLTHLEAQNKAGKMPNDVTSPKPHMYAFFTNMQGEVDRHWSLLATQCQLL